MRVFLISFSLSDVARELTARGIQIVYWTGVKTGFDQGREEKQTFSKTIFHNSFDALAGIPAREVDTLALPAVPKTVWDALAPIGGQVLAMIDRADYSSLTFNQRLDLCHRYINYWYGVLAQYRPEAVIFADIPHTGSNYIIYSIAKILHIKTLMYRRVKGFTDRILLFDDFTDYRHLRERYGAILRQSAPLDLGAEMEAYYLKEKGRKEAKYSQDISTFVSQGYKNSVTLPPFRKVIRRIFDFTFWGVAFRYVRMLLHKRRVASVSRQYFRGWEIKWLFHKGNKVKTRLRAEYERLAKEPDLSAPFIYLPLHFQPECNTNPLGGIFDNQLLLARLLSQSLPAGWKIYVKENPLQWTHCQGHLGRYYGYYQCLAAIPGVALVPVTVPTYDLIDKSRAVATITGTAGWEAVLRGKGALVFGHAWYKDCEGVFQVGDQATVARAVNRLKEGYAPDQQRVRAYLKAFSDVSTKAYPDKRYKQFSGVASGENARAIADAIFNQLSSY